MFQPTSEAAIHDRDTKFTAQFDQVLSSAGAKVQKTPNRSPNLQAHVERVPRQFELLALVTEPLRAPAFVDAVAGLDRPDWTVDRQRSGTHATLG